MADGQQAASVEPGNAGPPPDAQAQTPPSGEGTGNPPQVGSELTPPEPGNEGNQGPNGSELNGRGSEPSIWDGLSDENRTIVNDRKWDSVEAAVTSYRELEKKLGERADLSNLVPGDDATPEQVNEFYNALGRPETPEGYEFKLPEGVPENVPYDANFANAFRTWAHEAGVPQKAAAALHDRYVTHFAEQAAASQQKTVGNIEAAHGEIVKAWGDPETDGYKRQQELARRSIQQLGLDAALRETGVLDPATGMVTSAPIALALAKVGGRLFAEDQFYGGPSTPGPNPFSKETQNLTQQGSLIKNDPDRARNLIRAAGQRPSDFGLED